MIIREILLENWGTFRDKKEIELSEGLNLLIGENESGKSTVADALRLAFFDKHTTHSGKIKELIPWSSTLPPKVVVVFETNGEVFRIAKRFVYSPGSMLEKNVQGKWERINEGDAADKRVIELIGGELPSRGQSKPVHWGLAQVLWARQGEILPEDEVNEEIKTRIRSTTGAVITTEDESKIRDRLRSTFNDILTSATRKFKSGSELDEVLKRIEKLEADKAELEEKLRNQEILARAISDRQEDLLEKEESLRKAKEALENTEDKVKQADEHKELREGIDSEVKTLERDYKDLSERVSKIKSFETGLDEGERQIRSKEKQIHEEEEEFDEIAGELKTKQEEVKELKRHLSTKQNVLTLARQVWGTLRDQVELKELQAKLGKILDLECEKKEIEARLRSVKAPTQSEINKLRRLKGNIDKKKTQLEAIGLTAQFTAKDELKGTVLLDEEKKEFEFKAESTVEWKSAQRIGFELPGIAELEVKSGSEDVQKLREESEELEGEYLDKTAVYETRDIDELERKTRERTNLEGQLEGLDKRLSDISPGGLEELEKRVKVLERHIEKNWSKIPSDSPFMEYKAREDSEEALKEVIAKIELLEGEIKRLERGEKGLNTEIERKESKRDAKREEINELKLSLQSLKGELEQMKKQLKELKDDGMSEKERQEKLEGLGYELDRKKNTLKRLKEEKEEKENEPKEKFKEAQQRYERLREMVENSKNDISNLEGQLQQQIKEGAYSELAVTEEELQDLKRREEKLKVYVRAVELLYDLYEFHMGKTMKSVMEPLTKIVSDNLQRLVGPKYGAVKLNDDFLPASVEVPDWRIEVGLAPLSYGTKEQLAFLIRLALGEILSKEEKQLVILDDPLTNTHISRLKPALEIMREASRRLQLMVLTCHPSQYSELGDMNVVEM
jgi:DNA repair exonuclease SbcCD ATPase subunit